MSHDMVSTAPRVGGCARVGGGRPHSHPGRRGGERGGSVLIWMLVVFVVLTGFCSLAVDVGRVYVVRGELQLAADAAVRHGAHTFHDTNSVSAARSAAVDCADDNRADGSNPVVLDPNLDVRFGTWDAATRTFTAATGAAEASATVVQVTARRTAARGNPVNLAFARMLGRATFDVTASAVARINTRRPGIVGLDYVTMSGGAGIGNETGAFSSKNGGSATTAKGTIASNGNISVSGHSQVRGDARPGPGKTVTVSGGGSVSGSTSPLPKALSYPAETAGAAATTNDNWRVSPSYLNGARDLLVGNVTLPLPGGVYYFNSVQVGASAVLAFGGPATVYITGNVVFAGNVRAHGNVPSNLRLVMTNTATDFAVSSSASVHANLYAPLSVFKASGSATLYGSVVARGIEMSGTARVLFDEMLTVTSPGVTIVQ